MNENRTEVTGKKQSRDSAMDGTRKPWTTPELRVLPVPGRTEDGMFKNSMKPESFAYNKS